MLRAALEAMATDLECQQDKVVKQEMTIESQSEKLAVLGAFHEGRL